MVLVRPRLTDFHEIPVSQANLPFAVPFLDEDLPLFVDPFLLWKSPSLQDQALHTTVLTTFNRIGELARRDEASAMSILIHLSECDEVGLGNSASKVGKRIGATTAREILNVLQRISLTRHRGIEHVEELQFYVEGIAKDRISDFTCCAIKSFLIDFTIEEAERIGLPLDDVVVSNVFNPRDLSLASVATRLPIHPSTGKPLLLVPKRWLRHAPWISFDSYFKDYIPKDERFNDVEWDRVKLLSFNRENYGVVEEFVRLKERQARDCTNDPLFRQIPVISAKRKYAEIAKLPTGKHEGADRKYEDAASALLASLFYPQLDHADTQLRVDSGAQIRDLVFYNSRVEDFLQDIGTEFGSRQIVMELKNVKAIEREHVNQLYRYLGNDFGRFGVLVTRNPLPRAIRTNTIDLWSSKRFAIVPITDVDLELMVNLFEQKQRAPTDVLKRAYITFMRECPI